MADEPKSINVTAPAVSFALQAHAPTVEVIEAAVREKTALSPEQAAAVARLLRAIADRLSPSADDSGGGGAARRSGTASPSWPVAADFATDPAFQRVAPTLSRVLLWAASATLVLYPTNASDAARAAAWWAACGLAGSALQAAGGDVYEVLRDVLRRLRR